MIDFVFDYMEVKDVDIYYIEEKYAIEDGIRLYLYENGIDIHKTGAYYKKYVKNHLDKIDTEDLKAYFLNYDIISEINRFAIEWLNNNSVTRADKDRLYKLMQELYLCGLKDKYIPITTVREILDS